MPQPASDVKISYVISGFADCPYYQKALSVGQQLESQFPNSVVIVNKVFSRDDFHKFRQQELKKLGHGPDYHKTCPMVYTESAVGHHPGALIGGCDDFINIARTEYKLKV